MTIFNEITLINYARPLRERLAARKYVGPYKWRPNTKNNGIGFYQASNRLAMDSHGSAIDLRLEDCRPNYRGVTAYYCDDDGSTTMTPIIARLPRSRGFLAGWTMGAGMCASLDNTVYSDEEDAWMAAHDEAEHEAERERDYQESIDEESNDDN